jgi:hypothetical protein
LAAATPNIGVSSPLTIVGRNAAVLTPSAGGDAITITSGEIYLRNLTIQGTASPKTGIGINAAPTSGSAVTLHMDTCAVTNNPGGGILLNGAAFDIKNTTVTGNGLGAMPATRGAASYVKAFPQRFDEPQLGFDQEQHGGTGLDLRCVAIQGTGVLASGNIQPFDITTTLRHHRLHRRQHHLRRPVHATMTHAPSPRHA